ncbi:MAG: hypothetical protein ACYDBJ_15570 [Aggregatilineales bacterium]
MALYQYILEQMPVIVHMVIYLAAQEILKTSRDNNLYISPYFYNTLSDIEVILAPFKKHHNPLH